MPFDPEALAPIVGGELLGNLILLPGSTIQDNEYGLDVLVRPFFAMEDEIFELAPRRGEPDQWLPNFVVTDRSFVSGRAKTATALITYKGLIGNDLPPPTVKGGWRETSAQLSTTRSLGKFGDLGMLDIGVGSGGTNNNGSVTPTNGGDGSAGGATSLTALAESQSGEVSVTYHSPTTTFFYISRKEPKKPRFPNVLLASDGDFQIVEILPASFRGRPIANREIRTISFEKEKVGRYWQVMEANQGLLTSLPVTMMGAKAMSFPPGYKPRQLNLR